MADRPLHPALLLRKCLALRGDETAWDLAGALHAEGAWPASTAPAHGTLPPMGVSTPEAIGAIHRDLDKVLSGAKQLTKAQATAIDRLLGTNLTVHQARYDEAVADFVEVLVLYERREQRIQHGYVRRDPREWRERITEKLALAVEEVEEEGDSRALVKAAALCIAWMEQLQMDLDLSVDKS